jgi:hypothetical protein
VELALHMEIAYRSTSTDLASKIKDDAVHLMRSIRQAVEKDHRPPWTALIRLGGAWDEQRAKALSALHEASHDFGGPVKTGGFGYWPLIDAIVTPDGLFKKHTLFDDADGAGRERPCYLPVPSPGSGALQGLAVARAYLVHRLRLLERSPEQNDERSWPETKDAALLGASSAFRRFGGEGGERLRGFTAEDLLDDHGSLWHLGYNRELRIWRPIEQIVMNSPRCSRGCRFIFVPRAALRGGDSG